MDLFEQVLTQLVTDVKNNDFTAIEEMLQFVPIKVLENFLPEE